MAGERGQKRVKSGLKARVKKKRIINHPSTPSTPPLPTITIPSNLLLPPHLPLPFPTADCYSPLPSTAVHCCCPSASARHPTPASLCPYQLIPPPPPNLSAPEQQQLLTNPIITPHRCNVSFFIKFPPGSDRHRFCVALAAAASMRCRCPIVSAASMQRRLGWKTTTKITKGG